MSGIKRNTSSVRGEVVHSREELRRDERRRRGKEPLTSRQFISTFLFHPARRVSVSVSVQLSYLLLSSGPTTTGSSDRRRGGHTTSEGDGAKRAT